MRRSTAGCKLSFEESRPVRSAPFGLSVVETAMKTLIISVLTLAVLGTSAAGAAPLRHRHHHKVCSVRHHHRVCRWV